MLETLFGRPPARRASATGRDDDALWYPAGRMLRTMPGLSLNTRANVRVDEDTALTLAAVWCATRVLVETAAALPRFLYRRRADGGREVADDHAHFGLMKSEPAPGMTSMAWSECQMLAQVNWGNAFAEIEREDYRRPASPVVALHPIHPSRVRPVRAESDAYKEGYRYQVTNNDGSRTVLKAAEVLHTPGVLTEDGVWGKGVIAYARESVGFGLGVERFGQAYFGGGGQPKAVLYLPGLTDPEKRKSFRTEWKEVHASPDSGEVAILPPEAKYQALSLPPEDMQFLTTREHNVSDVARWYRMPPHKLYDLRRGTFSNIEFQSIEFVVDSLLPWLVRQEQQWNLKLLSPADRGRYYFKHQLAGLLRGDTLTRFKAYQVALQYGWMSVNEARELEDMNPIGPAGDKHYFPVNMTTLEALAAAPAPAAPGTAPPPGAAEGEGESADATEADGLGEGPGVGAAASAAARELLLPVVRGWLGREARAVLAKGQRRANFPAWLDDFHRGQAAQLKAALGPPALALGVPADRLAAALLADGRAALLAAYETDTREAFAARLEAWPARAPETTDSLLRSPPCSST